ncbi:hypothetical protein K466DRAFT_601386 [Polyporus arcularius HHB13444]|uniref:DUF6534 domain-containing protein n=1 Tax=Polyporus arcularius HHB13444 TaxID=1314778 RepID=A0A5C3P6C4_9APHY|nr:hypothetical protein K466DRAFT_601386 [Polyporus arcularius HHB13444]
MLLGSFIGTVLYGALLHQAYRYMRLYPTDGAFMKTLLLSVCAVLVGIATHLFFILRIWKIKSHLRFLAVLATGFHVIELALGIVMSVRGFQLGGPAYFSKKWLIALCFGAGTLADLSITGALLAVMYNGHSTHERQSSIWDNVSVYFINTGLLVLILDLVVFILVLSTDNNLYWSAVHAVTTKIYATTLMSVLNCRKLGSNDGFKIHSGAAVRSIAHARRLATVQRWNVPEEPETMPERITINVQTEREGDDADTDFAKLESGMTVDDKRFIGECPNPRA